MENLGIDGKLFMQDLYSKVKSKGALLKQKRFNTLQDVANLPEPIIINCTSIGSRELFGDQEFIPTRGQIVYFTRQEGVDYVLYQNVPNDQNSWVSIYPWSDRIILGGVYELAEEEQVTNQEVINRIVENGQNFLSGTL